MYDDCKCAEYTFDEKDNLVRTGNRIEWHHRDCKNNRMEYPDKQIINNCECNNWAWTHNEIKRASKIWELVKDGKASNWHHPSCARNNTTNSGRSNMSDKKIEIKSTHAELYEIAINAHRDTGGAPIEVSDGTRKVKIGPWMPGVNKIVETYVPMFFEILLSKKNG